MTLNVDIFVKGKKILLRRAQKDDVDYIMKLTDDKENKKYIVTFPRKWHESAVTSGASGNTFDVIVEEIKSGAPVGYIMINDLKNEFNEVEWTHFVIDKKGIGYGHEAMKLLKRWTFEVKKAHRAWMDCKEYNARALHLYESEGMIREGVIRETIISGGVYENLIILGILDREYFARKRAGEEEP